MNDRIHGLSDFELYAQCKKFGEIALKYKWKFAGLLPEVFRRKLYKKKGFGSIFEFAAKLAGMSEEQVRRVLNLEKKFEDKPELREMLVSGEVSVNKLARVASVATSENQEFWAGQVRLLSQAALETLVRDEKFAAVGSTQPVLQNNGETNNSVRAHTFISDTHEQSALGLSSEIINKLSELKRRGIDINDLLLEFLERRELLIAQEKERLAKECEENAKGATIARMEAARAGTAQPGEASRYIPAAIRKVLMEEHGEKCSIETCEKPSQEIHHTQRFSLSQNHNPKFLAPLCKEHHNIAHTVDWQFHDARLRAAR